MEHRVAERLPRKQEGSGSSPDVRARLLRLSVKAAQIRAGVGQQADRSLGMREAAGSIPATSAASRSDE